MSAFTRIRSAIQTAADAGSLLLRAALGTPGAKVLYPEAGHPYSETRDTGAIWSEDIIPLILEKIGAELDNYQVAMAQVSTNATSVAPTFDGVNWGISGVAKNETNDWIEITFSPAFSDWGDYACFVHLMSPAMEDVQGKTASVYTVSFVDHAGVAIDINSQTAIILAVGKAAS